MKQHIATEQLDKLSKRERERLRSWCKEKKLCFKWWGNEYSPSELRELPKDFTEGLDKEGYTDIPFLSIGQMIEFLDENRNYKKEGTWYINFYGKKNHDVNGCVEEEICDALWLVVKEVLEKK